MQITVNNTAENH